ncbi:MAG: hypothetical protein MR411_06640 [Tenericutes bacterium]|nr:hypothetical protein [Mycoplasmatota bacterium]MDD6388969.1 hypothetical protein [Bacilli bacterium]MDY3801670.1 hypothetical protein [Bacilli bacterium]
MEIKMEFDYTHLGPIPDDKEINFQRLIIKEDGRVFLTSYNCNKKILKKNIAEITDAKELISHIINSLDNYDESIYKNNVGCYKIVSSNQDIFSGSLDKENNFFIDLSNTIRNAISLKNMKLFDEKDC